MSSAHPTRSHRFSTGLAAVVLMVKDLTVSARFYREVVGLVPESEQDDQWSWFWAGPPGEPQRIGLHTGSCLGEAPPSQPQGICREQIHCAFSVPQERLADAVAQVCAQGVGVFGPVHSDGARQAVSYYFYDPDSNLLEFWSPTPDLSFSEQEDAPGDRL